MIVSLSFCAWLFTSFHLISSGNLINTTNISKYIQNNRGIRNTKNDAPKDFRKRSRKIKSDIVSRIISQKTEASNILYYL